jgi:hypothetical protein
MKSASTVLRWGKETQTIDPYRRRAGETEWGSGIGWRRASDQAVSSKPLALTEQYGYGMAFWYRGTEGCGGPGRDADGARRQMRRRSSKSKVVSWSVETCAITEGTLRLL